MDPLAERAREDPKTPLVDVGGVTFSHAEIDEQADRVARRLAGAGLGPGRTVATLLPNGPKTAWALFGVPRAGATLAPLNTRWSDRELVRYLQHLSPATVLASQETETVASRVVQAANLVSLDRPSSARALHVETLPSHEGDLPGPRRARPHTVMPTSGTSGRPKAVTFQLEAHLAHARAATERLDLGSGDRWLSVLSPAHIGGLALWLRPVTLGSTVVPADGFDAGHVGQLVDEGRVTHASLVPAMLARLLDERDGRGPPDAFALALVGGAACPTPLLERALDAGWPVALTYGCTEAASQVATAPPSLVRDKPGTVGPPLDGLEVTIGEDDEVLVRGPTLTDGYLGEEQGPVDADGWLATGDAGELDEEGHLWITGRLSERIVSGGLTIDPVEVEDVVREHPGVADACVLGVPDERWGEVVTAAVVARETGTLDAETLHAFVEGELASGKRPRAWAFLDELPRNANGKIDRDAVRDRIS